MTHPVVIVGAGISGLFAALALRERGIRPLVIEQDLAPDDSLTVEDSSRWQRRGVPQARHPHFFMGRLRELLLAKQPSLASAMLRSGVWELPFLETLGPVARAGYRPQAGDAQLTCLVARRTTFELVLRRHVLESGIEIQSGSKVLRVDVARTTPATVRGVVVAERDGERLIEADVVIDAAGRRSGLVDELRRAGARIEEERHDSQIAYFTRLYRLNEGAEPPPTTGSLGIEFPDFTVGALPADHGTFTVTVSVWRDDPVLGHSLKRATEFERLCRGVPQIAEWIEPTRSVALGDVWVFAAMDCFWRALVANGGPQVRGFFCIGDAAVRTNPKYGRGCTWGAEQAHVLADTLAEITDPDLRLLHFDAELKRRFRRDWETTLRLDRASRVSFERAVLGRRSRFADSINDALGNEALKMAIVLDSEVQRAVMSGYHGMTAMDAWTRRPGIWMRVLRAWAMSSRHPVLVQRQRARPERAAFGGSSAA